MQGQSVVVSVILVLFLPGRLEKALREKYIIAHFSNTVQFYCIHQDAL